MQSSRAAVCTQYILRTCAGGSRTMAGESQLCLFRAGTCRWWTCQISEIGNEPGFLRGLPCFERGAGAGGVGLGENSLRRGGFFHPRRSGRQLDGFTSHHLNHSALSRGGGGEVPTQDCHGTGGKDERYTPSPISPSRIALLSFPPFHPAYTASPASLGQPPPYGWS
jgi:hypothetical protein